MLTNIINGKNILYLTKKKIFNNLNLFQYVRNPGLAIINIGENEASKIYVYEKKKACISAGINFDLFNLKSSISQVYCVKLVEMLNRIKWIDGILIQLPLPFHVKLDNLSRKISIKKDIDGFHPYNFGNLSMGYESIVPCTCLAVVKILKNMNKKVESSCVVIIGSSNIVGKPIALELLVMNATVIICNKYTSNLEFYINLADILIIAVGKAGFISNRWIKDTTIVIDIGINRKDNGKVVGDFFIKDKFSKPIIITSVPGGIGPLTISSLLHNTFNSFVESR